MYGIQSLSTCTCNRGCLFDKCRSHFNYVSRRKSTMESIPVIHNVFFRRNFHLVQTIHVKNGHFAVLHVIARCSQRNNLNLVSRRILNIHAHQPYAIAHSARSHLRQDRVQKDRLFAVFEILLDNSSQIITIEGHPRTSRFNTGQSRLTSLSDLQSSRRRRTYGTDPLVCGCRSNRGHHHEQQHGYKRYTFFHLSHIFSL